MATTTASKTTEEDVRKKANYTTVYSFDTETMQVTYVAHDPFYLSLSLSLSPINLSLSLLHPNSYLYLQQSFMSSVPIK